MTRSIKSEIIAVAAIGLAAMLVFANWNRLTLWLTLTYDSAALADQDSIILADHVVTIEAKPIAGLTRNVSGLTYNSTTGTLFTTINRPAGLAELSLDGRLLRHVALPSDWDAEGIAHVQDDLFIIADEGGSRLHWIRLAVGNQVIHEQTTDLSSDWKAWPNLGFEGVSWNQARSELLLVNEKWPRRILSVEGLWPPASRAQIKVREWWPGHLLGISADDLASITTDADGNLILLSQETGIVLRYGRDGDLSGVLPLWRGFSGLKENIGQAEGITITPDGSIYIVSEPNLFYRLSPRASGP